VWEREAQLQLSGQRQDSYPTLEDRGEGVERRGVDHRKQKLEVYREHQDGCASEY
jgi:hypothetical protein